MGPRPHHHCWPDFGGRYRRGSPCRRRRDFCRRRSGGGGGRSHCRHYILCAVRWYRCVQLDACGRMVFGSALVAGLATFAVTSIGLGTIWAGIKSFGAMLGSWIARGLSGIWSGLRWLGGKAWGGLRWLGGKTWGGLKWLGSKMWGVLKPAGSWVWTFIKANVTAGLVSALASMAIDGFKYFVLGESMT